MIWITVKTAAQLCGIKESATKKAAYRGDIQFRKVPGIGRGGKQLQILLESLPEKAQARYQVQQEAAPTPDEIENVLEGLTEEQRREAIHKKDVVMLYKDFKIWYRGRGKDYLEAFLEWFGNEHPEIPITRRMVTKWQAAYEREGISGLVDRRGGWNRGNCSIPEDVWNTFNNYYMQEKGTRNGGMSIALCYELTQRVYPDQKLPSISAFKRKIQTIPKAATELCRKGEKFFNDKFSPYIPMDYSATPVNGVWVADNHTFDLYCTDETGRIFRPYMVAWQDFRSRIITGYLVIDKPPNSDFILDSFAVAVQNFGKPECIHIDNGKDYCVHDLLSSETYSLATELETKVQHAKPYNAQAKGIERFFNTLEYGKCVYLPSYFGANPKRRPRKMKSSEDEAKKYAIPFREFQSFVQNVVNEYNNTRHTGDSMNGLTPLEAFNKYAESITRIPNRVMRYLFMRCSRPLKVGRNGVRVPELQDYYSADQLFLIQGQQIIVRYHTSDVSKVYCFDLIGKLICIADKVNKGTFDPELTAQLNRDLNEQKKRNKAMLKPYLPDGTSPAAHTLVKDCHGKPDLPDLSKFPNVVSLQSAATDRAEQMEAAEAKRTAPVQKNKKEREKKYFNYLTGGLKNANEG